ncbi:iron complex transport system ATP-binding protein [Agrobacterium larrymoorei]|uniref:Iron complex transport system ATP-binding protein n=1 Tax=Agrobacterium larrymoorei TaxID=160699 RepID=A0AAJ2B6A0_9HYPH|nr:ATP-binding cassette domain-containing protein [Agrobacterium larrymoorei]MDR6100109.1 iron complex transport system ATP-binding protein [Agrobacterium larrymoorei]
MITIEKVSVSHSGATILKNVSLTIPKHGVTALIGPNGAGKSTLLSLIARLQPLQSGQIAIDGHRLGETNDRDLAKIIAILRQDSVVTSRLRVRELVSFGRFPHSRGRLADRDRDIVAKALARFALDDLADRFIDTLSGGQRQRALVAMTFAQETDYILLDEPLNNLDMYFARELMLHLRALADEDNKSIIIVLHDINQAAAHADRIIAMKNGCVVADGAPSDIINPSTLREIYGFDMRVETIDGTPVVLHFK